MIATILYEPVAILVKVSILLQYVTVFVVHRKGVFHCLVHIIIWANVVFHVILLFLYLFRVSPPTFTEILDMLIHLMIW